MLGIFTATNILSIFVDSFRNYMALWQKIKGFVWSKHFLKHTGFIVLTYIVIIVGLILYLGSYTNHGEKIEVPNLIGMKSKPAEEKLLALDLKIEVLDSVYRPDLPAGTIVSQDPISTKESMVCVKSGRIIRIQVSKKNRLVEMPSLIDKSQRFAESVLKNRGLKYKITFVPSSEANGAVLKQLFKGSEIKEGKRIPIGSVITIVVGQNGSSEPVELPNLDGMTISEARGRLSVTNIRLLVGACDGCTNGDDTLNAVIHTQSPEFLEGVMISPGTTIMVSASKGQ